MARADKRGNFFPQLKKQVKNDILTNFKVESQNTSENPSFLSKQTIHKIIF